jgi:hypothetical protein
LPGQSPAQLANCPALGKCSISTPISATITAAATSPILSGVGIEKEQQRKGQGSLA